MLESLAILGVLVFAAWGAGKLVFGRATQTVYLAATVMSVFLGFVLMRFGSDPEAMAAGRMDLSGIALLGFLLILGGLVCGLTIAIIGIVRGLARHQKGRRK